MFTRNARQRSLFVYHLHMGGPDADAVEWRALLSSRFAPRLEQMGVRHVGSAPEADIVVLTGVVTEGNLDAVLAELAQVPLPSVLVAAGDAAANGAAWAKLELPRLSAHLLSHYADIQVSVPGAPPTPQALIAAIAAAAEALGRPGERIDTWEEET
jgi:membrane-bound hydrogenase subunit mbhJ